MIIKLISACTILCSSIFGQSINSSSQPGATADVQISNAIAALAGNGTVVADYLTVQTFAACPLWGSNKIILELRPVQFNLNSACTIPINVSLKMWNGALLAPAANINFFINGNVDAQPQQRIVNITNGNVVFQHVPTIWWDWYGAADLANSDGPIQAGLNALALTGGAAARKPPFLCVPGGNYTLHSRPLHIATGNVIFGGPGSGSESCGFRENWGFGPSLVIGPSPAQGYCGQGTTCTVSAPLVAGLTTSGGNALNFDGIHPYWFNLSLDTKELNAMNGLTQLTLEAFVNTSAVATGMIMGSSGRFAQSDPVTQAFSLLLVGSVPTCKINTSNGMVQVNGGSLTVGTTAHVACSWDGSTVRLFVAGVETASGAATGTLLKKDSEDVTIGPALQSWPDAGVLTNACKCTIDSPKISNIALYTSDAGFTPPTAKLVKDANTLALLNFANCFDVFCDFQSKDANGFLFFRNATFAAALNNVQLKDLVISTGTGFGGGLYWYQTNRWQQNNLHIALNTGAADYFWNNSFIGSARTLYIDAGGTGNGPLGHDLIGLGMVGAVGVIELDDVNVTGGQYQIVGNGGSGQFNRLYTAPTTETSFSVFAKGSGGSETFQFNNLACDAEVSGAGATFQACAYISNMRTVQFIGGELEATQQSPLWVDGGESVTVIGSRFLQTISYPAQIVHVVNPPTQTIHIFNAVQAGTQFGHTLPWCDNMTACLVQ